MSTRLRWYDGTAWWPVDGYSPGSGSEPEPEPPAELDPWSPSYPTPLEAVWAGDPDWTSNPGDGNPVSVWRNESGGGSPAQATAAARPTFRASTAAYNNKPTVQFDGNDFLHFNVANVSQPIIVVAVGNTSGANGVSERIISTVDTSGGGVGDHSSGTWLASANGATNNIQGGTANSSPHVFMAILNGASSSLWVDGTQVATGNAASDGLLHFTLGGNSGGASVLQPLTGHIAYGAFYSGSTRSAGMLALEAALAEHYGITLA